MVGTRQHRGILAHEVCDVLMRWRMPVYFVLWIFFEELRNDAVPFFRHQAAHRVHDRAGTQERGGVAKHRELQHRHARRIAGLQTPSNLRMLPQRASPRAWRIEQDVVKTRGPQRNRFGDIGAREEKIRVTETFRHPSRISESGEVQIERDDLASLAYEFREMRRLAAGSGGTIDDEGSGCGCEHPCDDL